MGIVVVILSALFLALGAIPSVASNMATTRVRERLQAPASVTLQAVPTWRLLRGDVDRLELVAGRTKLGEMPIDGLTVQGGPCRMDAPCRLDAALAIATRDLEPIIRTNLTAYTASLAETLGVPGAEVADLAIELGNKAAVSGRFEALGGIVSVPFRVEGQLASLGPQTVGLMAATVTINEQVQPLGDIPVWTLPEPPLAGLQVALQRLTVTGDRLQAWLQLEIDRPADLLLAQPGATASP
jgi:hypothetical protein